MARTKDNDKVETQLGSCWWCKREQRQVYRGWDSLFKCAARQECDDARSRRLIETNKRPRSFYEELAAGKYANRRDCRKVGLTNGDIKALVESLGLTYETKETKDSERAADVDPDA